MATTRKARHSWRPVDAMEWKCSRCTLRKRWNLETPSRPFFSRDGGERWSVTEHGYTPPCEPNGGA